MATIASDPLAMRNIVDMQFVSDENVVSSSDSSWSGAINGPFLEDDCSSTDIAVLNDWSDPFGRSNRDNRFGRPFIQRNSRDLIKLRI